MYVAYKAGDEPPKLKKPKKLTYKQQVDQLAAELMAKWKHRDRIAAMKKHGLIK